jgi:fluoroacetyl-CoA thioesterase
LSELEPGLQGEVTGRVDESRTAVALGSGDVPVLGTPAVLALAEAAALAAVAGRLGDGATTVGTWVELEHLAPTPAGAAVSARATLVAVDGRTLEFEFEVADGAGPVARGRHRRAVVDRARFLDTAAGRTQA